MTPEQLNAYRIIPRILMAVYYSFFIWAFIWVTEWFMNYDFDSITNEGVALAVAGFPAAILGVLSAVLASLTKNYFNTPGGNGG